MPGPLDGVRVFDLTLWMVGPWASTQLGALGADVIHIEQPSIDPRTLGAGVPPTIDGTSIGYMTWNQNKRGLFLDLKSASDRQTAYELLQTCDVFLIQHAPRRGRADGRRLRTGRGRQSQCHLHRHHRLGRDRPNARQAGRRCPGAVLHRLLVGQRSRGRASGGLSAHGPDRRHHRQRGRPGGPDGPARTQANRQRAAHSCRHASRGHGAAKPRIAEYLHTETLHQPQGSAAFPTAPDQAFQCQWGDWIGVSVTSEDEWQRFAEVMRASEAEVDGIDELATDPRWRTNRDRVSRRTALAALLQAGFLQRPRHYWMLRLSAAGIPCGYPISFEMLQHHAQTIENQYLREVETSGWGKVWTGGAPWSSHARRLAGSAPACRVSTPARFSTSWQRGGQRPMSRLR